MFPFQLFSHVLRAVLAELYFHVLLVMCFLIQGLTWILTKKGQLIVTSLSSVLMLAVYFFKAETPYFGHFFFHSSKFSDLMSCMYCVLSEMLHCEFKRQEKRTVV